MDSTKQPKVQLEYNRTFSTKVKTRDNYICQKCGNAEKVQAHAPNGDHSDWTKGISLCAKCHSEEHPDIPRELFFRSEPQPHYWSNIKARTLAETLNCPKWSVIGAAKELHISPEKPLSNRDKKRIALAVLPPRIPEVVNQCLVCKSYHIVKTGFYVTRLHGRRQKMKCQNCGRINYLKLKTK